MRKLAWLVPVALLCAACGSSPEPLAAEPAAQVAPAAQVELDVFSGRPNPTWTLTDAESADLAARLAALPAASASELAADLGYRGFVVRTGSGTVAVQKGLVARTGDGDPRYYTDPDRALERWLLDTGDDLEPAVTDVVEQDLDA